MPDTDFGALADERVNKKLDGFKEIVSKEEYYKKLEDYFVSNKGWHNMLDAKTRPWVSIRKEMYEDSEAVGVVENNQRKGVSPNERAVGLAHRFEDRRLKRSRLRDERVTAKNTKRVTMSNYRNWRRAPSRSDLRGVDTRRRRAFTNKRLYDARTKRGLVNHKRTKR